MTDAELRALIREIVARRLSLEGTSRSAADRAASAPQVPSHQLHLTLVNAESACVIEPAVTCDHCGYCKSHGY